MILYIDPGTGSMLFSIAISLISVIWFGVRKLYLKMKYLTLGKAQPDNKTIPLVIFSDGKQYWQFFEPVCRELNSRSFDVTYYTMSEDDPALKINLPHLHAEFIGNGNKAFAKMNFLKATIVLSTTPGLDVFQWKRSKDVRYYVHMLHGVEMIGYKMFGVDFYDALLLSAHYQEKNVRYLEETRKEKKKEIEMIGIPYWDAMKQRIIDNPMQEHEITVLLAPTWGKRSVLLREYGNQILDTLVATGYRIIVRPHPQSFISEKDMLETLMQRYGEKVEWNRDANNFDVLNLADIIISEYSGVVYDFSMVFDKPAICMETELDFSQYDAAWLENATLWTYKALPKLGKILKAEDIPNLKKIIDRCLTDDKYKKSRDSVRAEVWSFPKEGAKLEANYLLKKIKELQM